MMHPSSTQPGSNLMHPTNHPHMYPYERYMSIIKDYVRNRAHPEASMIEGYTTEEVLECYNDYMKDGKPISVTVSRYEGDSLEKEPHERKHSTNRVAKG
jgi:hypothetical protein